MVPKPFNLKQTTSKEEGSRKQLHGEIREVTSAITHHLNGLHHIGKSSSNHQDEVEEEQGVQIITLAGNNAGATMKGELDEKPDGQDDKAFTAYTNSNFQAINNSIMYGGSYNCKDPGVHIATCMDYAEPGGQRARKGKTKVRGASGGSSDDSSE